MKMISKTHPVFGSGSGVPLSQDVVTSNGGAWLSNATLRFFSLAEQCHTQEFLIWLKNENNPKNLENSIIFLTSKLGDLKNEDNLKNEDDLKKEDDLEN